MLGMAPLPLRSSTHNYTLAFPVPHLPLLPGGRWRCITYIARRARLCLSLLDTLDLLGRTSELARTFGIDFFSVLSRGSQYRVESLLLRLAHSQNYLAVSPSRDQVGGVGGLSGRGRRSGVESGLVAWF